MFGLISVKRLRAAEEFYENEIASLRKQEALAVRTRAEVEQQLELETTKAVNLAKRLEESQEQNQKLDAAVKTLAEQVDDMQMAVDEATANYQEKVDELQALKNGMENFTSHLIDKFRPLVAHAENYRHLMATRNSPTTRKKARYDLFEQLCHLGASLGSMKVKRDLGCQIESMAFEPKEKD